MNVAKRTGLLRRLNLEEQNKLRLNTRLSEAAIRQTASQRVAEVAEKISNKRLREMMR